MLFGVTIAFIDREATLRESRRLGLLLPLVVLPSGGWHAVRTLGWLICFPTETRPSFWRLFRVRLAADAVSYFTIRGLASEPLRVVLLLSLAGIPFVVGFWAKLYIFAAALKADLTWLVVVGAVLAVVALFYYLRIVKAMYMARPRRTEPIRVSPGVALGIAASVAVAVVAGLWPGPLVAAAEHAALIIGCIVSVRIDGGGAGLQPYPRGPRRSGNRRADRDHRRQHHRGKARVRPESVGEITRVDADARCRDPPRQFAGCDQKDKVKQPEQDHCMGDIVFEQANHDCASTASHARRRVVD